MKVWARCRRKLLKAFHNEKKQQFDISKVPDIYDSAKYDAIHNSELGLNMKQLYMVSLLATSGYCLGVAGSRGQM